MANARNGSRGGAASEGIGRVLVADDFADFRSVLDETLSDAGYEVMQAETGEEVLRLAGKPESERPEVILLDIKLPDADGLEILQRLLDQGLDIPVIMMTSFGGATIAIKAMQMGASDYLTKPFQDLDEVVLATEKALRFKRLQQAVDSQVSALPKTEPSERIIGTSQEMIDIFKAIGRVARTPATVLITGETGTGKELMAEALHNASDRRSGPMIKVNCAALPETLLESELFGHEKGSYTGAIAQAKGRFELAHKGTIFLDEVGEMTLATQKKLLRVLQEREIERVGGTTPIKVDVRVVAATNKNLAEEKEAGNFREDLFYRLNVIPIHMPPLRERKSDIPALVAHFLDKHRYSPISLPAPITNEAIEALVAYDWPGNVRELENLIMRAVVLSRGELITPDHIVFQNEMNRFVIDVEQKVRDKTALDDMLRDVRINAVNTALRLCENDPDKAAEQLGLSPEEFAAVRAEIKPAHVTAKGA
jgi:two-component system response regulator AtoC